VTAEWTPDQREQLRRAAADRAAKLDQLAQYADADRRRKYADRYRPGQTPRRWSK
jgi:hypothetical protein